MTYGGSRNRSQRTILLLFKQMRGIFSSVVPIVANKRKLSLRAENRRQSIVICHNRKSRHLCAVQVAKRPEIIFGHSVRTLDLRFLRSKGSNYLQGHGKVTNNMAERVSDDAEEKLYPYPGKVKSRVWEYFRFRKTQKGPPIKANLDMDTVVCRLCKKTYSNHGKHLGRI